MSSGAGKGLAFVSRGRESDDSGGGTPPGPSSITGMVIGDSQITFTVTGDSGATNEIWYSVDRGAHWTNGASRVGNGTIVQTGLTNGTVYMFQCRASL